MFANPTPEPCDYAIAPKSTPLTYAAVDGNWDGTPERDYTFASRSDFETALSRIHLAGLRQVATHRWTITCPTSQCNVLETLFSGAEDSYYDLVRLALHSPLGLLQQHVELLARVWRSGAVARAPTAHTTPSPTNESGAHPCNSN